MNPRGRHNNCKYAPNIEAPQYIRQTLTDIKGEIDSNTIIVGDFNTLLTPMNLMLLTHIMSIIHKDRLHPGSPTANLGERHRPLGYKVHNTL